MRCVQSLINPALAPPVIEQILGLLALHRFLDIPISQTDKKEENCILFFFLLPLQDCGLLQVEPFTDTNYSSSIAAKRMQLV